jgi:hypothetical protein
LGPRPWARSSRASLMRWTALSTSLLEQASQPPTPVGPRSQPAGCSLQPVAPPDQIRVLRVGCRACWLRAAERPRRCSLKCFAGKRRRGGGTSEQTVKPRPELATGRRTGTGRRTPLYTKLSAQFFQEAHPLNAGKRSGCIENLANCHGPRLLQQGSAGRVGRRCLRSARGIWRQPASIVGLLSDAQTTGGKAVGPVNIVPPDAVPRLATGEARGYANRAPPDGARPLGPQFRRARRTPAFG